MDIFVASEEGKEEQETEEEEEELELRFWCQIPTWVKFQELVLIDTPPSKELPVSMDRKASGMEKGDQSGCNDQEKGEEFLGRTPDQVARKAQQPHMDLNLTFLRPASEDTFNLRLEMRRST